MNKQNWYWYVHWGYIYYLLDEKSHDLAYDILGDCLTSNSNIYYHKALNNLDWVEYSLNIIWTTRSSVIVESKILKDNMIYVSSTFTFIKQKKDNS